MMTVESKVAGLVNAMPDADSPGKESKFTGPAPEKAQEIADGVLALGRDGILALLGMIHDAVGGGAENYKPGYTLRCAILRVGDAGQEKQRKLLVDAIASRLGEGGAPKEVQKFLIRELQLAGGDHSVGLLGRLLVDEELCEFATQALIAIGDGAAGPLRAAWPKVRGRSRVTIAQALGVVRDGESVDALAEASSDEDGGVRLAAVWALANIGHPGGMSAVLKAAERAEAWERIRMTRACLLLAEKLTASGHSGPARRIYNHLRETRTDDSERHIREAAERGLTRARV